MSKKEIPAYCAQCQSSCPILCTVDQEKLVRVRADHEHPNAAPLCPKGLAGPELVHHPLRLKHPLMRTRSKGSDDPGWQRISWDKALDIIGQKLQHIKRHHGAHAVVFNRPGPGGSPAKDYAPWVVRLAYAFGSPNTLATGHVCQWHRDTGSKYTYGWQSWPEPDYEHTRLIMVWGHNPSASVSANVRDISAAVRRGAKLIVVDPRKTPLAEKADLWIQIRPGSDAALMLSLIHLFIENRSYDPDFVKHWTNAPLLVDATTGDLLKSAPWLEDENIDRLVVWDKNSHGFCTYDPATRAYSRDAVNPSLFKECIIEHPDGTRTGARPVLAHLKEIAARFHPDRTAGITGVSAQQIRYFADMLERHRPCAYYTYNGLEQHTHATQTNRALCTLYALTGHIDAPGGNVFFPSIPGFKVRDPRMLPPEVHALRIGGHRRPLGPAGFPNSSVQAYEIFETLLTDTPYPLKGMVAFGGNIVTANAPSIKGREALKKLDFYVQTELFMTPSAELADIVLPAATFFESPALKKGFPNRPAARERLQYRPPVIPPLHESKSDMEIIFELARRLDLGAYFWDGHMAAAFDDMVKKNRLTLAELQRHPRGISIPLKPEYRKYDTFDPARQRYRGFETPTGRVEIFSQRFKDHGYDPLPGFNDPLADWPASKNDHQRYPLILTCSKLRHFCHGQHRAIPSLRKAVPHPYVEMNPSAAKERGIDHGEWVAVKTHHGQIRCQAHVTDSIALNVVCIQHGWWQPCPDLDLPGYDPYSEQGANANLLYTADEIDPISGSVPYKAHWCNIQKLTEPVEEEP